MDRKYSLNVIESEVQIVDSSKVFYIENKDVKKNYHKKKSLSQIDFTINVPKLKETNEIEQMVINSMKNRLTFDKLIEESSISCFFKSKSK